MLAIRLPEDLEDIYLTELELQRVRSGESPACSSEEIRKRLDNDAV